MNRRSLILAIIAACMNCALSADVVSAANGVPALQPARASENAEVQFTPAKNVSPARDVASDNADMGAASHEKKYSTPHVGENSGEPAVHTPAPPAVHSQLDSEVIRRPGDATSSTSTTSPRPQSMELPRVAGALAMVIALIFLMRWGGKKLFLNANTTRSTRAVQVLSRSAVAPRQHILLLRVGRRVIVVGDSGSQMHPLSEITDADEVASLLGQLQDEKSQLPARAFNALFNRAREDMTGDEDEELAHEQTRRTVAEESGAEEGDDQAISETRDEITGLMDKIRVLSKHFRGGPA